MSQYQELMVQIKELETLAEEARRNELAGAIAEIKRLMSEHGVTASDLGLAPRAVPTHNTAKAAAKYRDHASGKTWTGHGRKPQWVIDWLANGQDLESLRV